LGQELARLVRLLERARADFGAQRRDGVDRAASLLLARLIGGGPQRLSVLADAVHSDPSTVSGQLAHLVDKGLVARSPDPQDGRAGRWTATEAGKDVSDECRQIRNRHTAAMLAGWPSHDVTRLVGLLNRLNTDFEAYRAQLGGVMTADAIIPAEAAQ
jgi:DNA-binding MarR family transcriptional regulator